MDSALAVGLAALGVALLALILAVIFELVRHPSLEIRSIRWEPPEARDHKFVQVAIVDPDPPRLMSFIARQRAERSVVSAEFRRVGSDELVKTVELGPIPTSSRPDAPPGEGLDAYGVAFIVEDGKAYAWSKVSYTTNLWHEEALELPRGEFTVRVCVQGLGLSCDESFTLDNTTTNFARFTLDPAGRPTKRWRRSESHSP